jgi:hypothetical protein
MLARGRYRGAADPPCAHRGEETALLAMRDGEDSTQAGSPAAE